MAKTRSIKKKMRRFTDHLLLDSVAARIDLERRLLDESVRGLYERVLDRLPNGTSFKIFQRSLMSHYDMYTADPNHMVSVETRTAILNPISNTRLGDIFKMYIDRSNELENIAIHIRHEINDGRYDNCDENFDELVLEKFAGKGWISDPDTKCIDL